MQNCLLLIAVELLTGPSLGVFKKFINSAKSKLLTGPRSFSHYKNRVSGDYVYSTIIVFFFGAQLSGKFLKIACFFFQKRVQKLGFSIFCILILNFENSPFLGLLKHYKKGFQLMLVFFVVQREEKGKKNDNWNFWIWVFLSNAGRFVTHICFSKNALLKSLFS